MSLALLQCASLLPCHPKFSPRSWILTPSWRGASIRSHPLTGGTRFSSATSRTSMTGSSALAIQAQLCHHPKGFLLEPFLSLRHLVRNHITTDVASSAPKKIINVVSIHLRRNTVVVSTLSRRSTSAAKRHPRSGTSMVSTHPRKTTNIVCTIPKLLGPSTNASAE
jgi:hypothetical protein